MNDRVKKSIVYFQTVARDAFIKFLSRSKRYEMLYREVLTQYGLPHDLIYLSMVESGFSPHAYSWARAMGLWQFIASTGRLYGLKRDWWLDERKDPIKSTHAAARFLKDLYEQFGDWELAMAAYNGGPGRVSRTVARQRTDDFWKLSTLPRQTKDYVPLIFAATIISKNPAKYGFDNIQYEPPVEWDEVTINKCLEFKTIAESINCSVESLKELNPELLRGITPPNFANYKLKVPTGKRHAFLASYDNMAASETSTLVKHTIRRGESLAAIAARYGISRYALAEANGLGNKAKLIAGRTLIVPVPSDRSYTAPDDNTRTKYKSNNSIYTVRSGDTMWDIAKAFGTSIDALRRLNYLDAGARIYVGQKLKIPGQSKGTDSPVLAARNKPRRTETAKPASRPSASDSYVVRPGDTVWEIAKRYNMTTTRLREINGLDRAATIRAGQTLKVVSNPTSDFVIHKVRSGDTISRIAATYRTTIAKILESNNLQNADDVKVGARLKIYKR